MVYFFRSMEYSTSSLYVYMCIYIDRSLDRVFLSCHSYPSLSLFSSLSWLVCLPGFHIHKKLNIHIFRFFLFGLQDVTFVFYFRMISYTWPLSFRQGNTLVSEKRNAYMSVMTCYTCTLMYVYCLNSRLCPVYFSLTHRVFLWTRARVIKTFHSFQCVS